MRIKVVIPALNEAESIGRVLDDIPPGLVEEVVVVDNGSDDGTGDVARRHGARVVVEQERGYGAACLKGIDAAGACDAIVFLDADYSDHPQEMVDLLSPLERDVADLVIGSRMIDPASRAVLLPQARFGNWLASRLLSLAYGAKVTDLGPFRAIRKGALDLIAMDDRDFGWTVQMQARALAAGLRVTEVPVSYRTRIGYSKISGTVSGTFKAGTKILYTIGREWLSPTTRRLAGVR